MVIDVGHPFTTTDWTAIDPTEHAGSAGFALWRTKQIGAVRIRMVEYTPGYVADHWCTRGHILLVIGGELRTELDDGRVIHLTAGQSYEVASNMEAHRSSTARGATLFIVD
jgi:hypothetical protein